MTGNRQGRHTSRCVTASTSATALGAANPDATLTLAEKEQRAHACKAAVALRIDDSFEFGLRTFPCNGLVYQLWLPNPSGGTFHWGSQATGRFIDDSEYGLRSFQRNNLDYQRFVSDA